MVDASPPASRPGPPRRVPEIEASIRRARELFNRREFFEAHEIWEEAWADSEMGHRHLLQGLIQVAAAFFKLQVGQPSGTFKLLEKARGHLEAVPYDFYDLNLNLLIGTTHSWQTVARRMLEAGQTAYDRDALPKLEYLEELQ